MQLDIRCLVLLQQKNIFMSRFDHEYAPLTIKFKIPSILLLMMATK